MKAKLNIVIAVAFLVLNITLPVFCLGQKQADECAAIDWSKAKEALIFGRLERVGGDVVIASSQPAVKTKTVYHVSGDRSRDVVIPFTGSYIFVRAIVAGLSDDSDRCIHVQEILTYKKSAIPDWSAVREITMMGLLEPGKDGVISIVTAWQSKSRVSNYVHGKYREELSKQAGRFAKVKCLIAEAPEDFFKWSKNIVVLSIEAISDNPIDIGFQG